MPSILAFSLKEVFVCHAWWYEFSWSNFDCMKIEVVTNFFLLFPFFSHFLFLPLYVSVWAARGLWDTGRGGVAVSDPGKLCHPLLLTALPLCCQPPRRRGDHHHGDWLPGMHRSCERKPTTVVECKCCPWTESVPWAVQPHCKLTSSISSVQNGPVSVNQ